MKKLNFLLLTIGMILLPNYVLSVEVCNAMAVSKQGGYGISSQDSAAKAETHALTQCKAHNPKDICTIIAVECNKLTSKKTDEKQASKKNNKKITWGNNNLKDDWNIDEIEKAAIAREEEEMARKKRAMKIARRERMEEERIRNEAIAQKELEAEKITKEMFAQTIKGIAKAAESFANSRIQRTPPADDRIKWEEWCDEKADGTEVCQGAQKAYGYY